MGKGTNRIIYKNTPDWFNVDDIGVVLETIVLNYNRSISQLSYEFVSREKIMAMNMAHLAHDYATDILTFDYSVNKGVRAEIVICTEVVEENAVLNSVTCYLEMCRVIIHGLLHLIGFGDKTAEEKQMMRKEEDFWLNKLDKHEE